MSKQQGYQGYGGYGGYGEYLLLHYREIKGQILLLEQELAADQSLSENSVIQAMSLRKDRWEKDKTGSTALIYREVTQRLNHGVMADMQLEIALSKGELQRLEMAVATLPPAVFGVLEGLYFEKKTGAVLCEKLEISPRTLYRYRNIGIQKLNDLLPGRCGCG